MQCMVQLTKFILFVVTNRNFMDVFFSTQIIAALAVSLGPLAAGLGKGYSSPAIASLQELQIRHRGNYTFTVTDQQASWVASLSLLGKTLLVYTNVILLSFWIDKTTF